MTTPKPGICKIVPPDGWWLALDYRKLIESTADQRAIHSPVKQQVMGARGNYTLELAEQPAESLASFEAKANKALRQVERGVEASSSEDRVRRFWRGLSATMPAPMYGADTSGSLFGDDDASGWNLNELDTVLQRNIWPPMGGVTDAMLYVGAWAAMFAYHVEDMNLYSINYLHHGAPKVGTHCATLPHNALTHSLTRHALSYTPHHNHAITKTSCTELVRRAS